jgi:hypothetical protein
VTSSKKVTGVWVDGFPATMGQAGRALREALATAEFLTVVVSDLHSVPRTVTLDGPLARDLATLTDMSTDLA